MPISIMLSMRSGSCSTVVCVSIWFLTSRNSSGVDSGPVRCLPVEGQKKVRVADLKMVLVVPDELLRYLRFPWHGGILAYRSAQTATSRNTGKARLDDGEIAAG